MSQPEYMRWYHPGSELMRCLTCAALLVEGDMEAHTAWHEKLAALFSKVARWV